MVDAQLPLLGAILCCTSIPPEKRSDLASMAAQMGAIHKLDLTSDVTHLIVGDTDTPKYKFVAKERPDVKCVMAGWIEAVRASWMEGGTINVEELEKEHRLPTLTGLKLCVTGFDDLIYRKQLEDSIDDNGGEYRGNLTRDVSHLIAKEPSGAKYNFAGQWGIRVVAVEWLEQSLERGMILDETLYSLSIPPEERGRNAWVRRSVSTTSLGKRLRADEIVPQNARKLRRTASARLSSQNVGFWTDFVGAPVKIEGHESDVWDDQLKETIIPEVIPITSKSDDVELAPTADVPPQTLNRSHSEINLGTLLGKPAKQDGLFEGKTVLLRGFNEKKNGILQGHLRSHGAQIVDEPSALPTAADSEDTGAVFLVIPHTTSVADLVEPELMKQIMVVSDLWVERCLHKKILEDPKAHVASTPFPKFPIAGFDHLTICSTGFQGIELLHASKSVALMGGTYSEYFTTSSSVLVCNTIVPGHEKLRHAQLWSIHAVTASWLWESIGKGELMPFGPYLVQPLEAPVQQSESTKTLEMADEPLASRKDDCKPATTNPTRRPMKKAASSEDRYKHPIKHPTKEPTTSGINEMPFDTSKSKKPPSPRTATTRIDETENPTIYLDDSAPTTFESNTENDSSHTLPNANTAKSTSAPLQEITPNSSPPKPCNSPRKSLSPSKAKQQPSSQRQSPPSPSEDSTLGQTISSLLAHHQRSNSNNNNHKNKPANPPPSSHTSDQQQQQQPRLYRRRRQLLGRAPSNLSSHSHNALDFSRASSVDTLNTDGLGTPLETSNSNRATPTITNNTNSKTNQNNDNDNPHIYTINTTHDDDPDRTEEPLQMTQLGYEDPDVAAWRERVAVKMGGGKVKDVVAAKTTPAGKKKVEVASLGIAKRTRLATGR